MTKLLADRKGDVVALIKEGDLILGELRTAARRSTRCCSTPRASRGELGGLVDDNQEQIGPMLRDLHEVTQVLVKRQDQLQASIHNLGPYVRILSNIIGTGPVVRRLRVQPAPVSQGEFKPGRY